MHLGGGRLRDGDRVNPSVGLSELAGLGEGVSRGVPLCLVHAADDAAADAAVLAVQRAYRIGTSIPDEAPLILKRVQ